MSRSIARAGFRVGLWLLALLAGGAMLACVSRPRINAAAPIRSFAAAAASRLPQTLAVSIAPAREQLVSAIAVDFDHDGDLDVIATDSALDLLVWVNDGADHLTRRQPARTTGWLPETPPPTLDELPALSNASTPNDPPSFRIQLTPWPGLLGRCAAVPLPDVGASSNWLRGSLSPRAPPAAS